MSLENTTLLESVHTWFHDLIKARGLTVEQVAGAMRGGKGVAKMTLYAMVEPFNSKSKLGVADLLELMTILGDYAPLARLAACTGHALVPLDAAGGKALVVETLDASAAAGKLAATVSSALADGRVSPGEAKEIETACVDVLRETGDVLVAVRKQ